MNTAKQNHIRFTKMQGAGNDFVVIDNRSQELSKDDIINLAPKICDRRFGVGSDGILALLPPEIEGADYTMYYRNADGSDAGMCGNGARCIARFAHSLGFDAKHTFNVHEQVYEAGVQDETSVTVSFPMKASIQAKTVEGEDGYFSRPGTEHFVIPVEQNMLENEDQLIKKGRTIRHHPAFKPKGTNVNFIAGENTSTIKLQTYERGVEDLTLACGTGAIASALVWHHLKKGGPEKLIYNVHTKGGTLKVHFTFDESTTQYQHIKLEGPAHFVFEGTFLQ